MPDFNPSRVSGQGPMRRRPLEHYGPGGLPSEGADPAPKPWPLMPWLALVVCIGFLALQLWPATHWRHPSDPSRTWHPIIKTEGGQANDSPTVGGIRRGWGPIVADDVVGVGIDENTMVGSDIRQSLEDQDASGMTKSNELLRRRNSQYVHVFLCSDEKDLRPLAVVINSTISNARHPERIKFHLLMPTSESKVEFYKFKAFFPSAKIEFISEGIDLAGISKRIQYREESKARKELSSPYNFLPFYLPHMYKDKDIDKFIYLDSDVVVKGDIEELHMKGLEGYPIAAVRDCSQTFKSYFDFKQLKEILAREKDSKPWLPEELFDEHECIFNRGALLMDVKQWIQQNITEGIEWWMEEYRNSTKVLYKYGLSQPPFLLALYKKYKELDHAWNIRGLGRDQFSALEQDFIAKSYGHRPDKKPFLSLESDYAKLLHFNGKFKPWKRDRLRHSTEDVVSLCGQEGHECYKLWWEYLSPIANDAFKNNQE